MLPNSMRADQVISDTIESKEKTAEQYAKRHGIQPDKLLNTLNDLRLTHDFEFWASTTVRIKPKEGGDFIPFILNKPQRKLLAKLESQRLADKPIRQIILKARQWGGSTLVQIYMAWIQLRHKTNWNSL